MRRAFQRALVTGASSGIGRAIAVELGRRGAHVVVAARREAELAETAELVRGAGGSAAVVVLDVSATEELAGRLRALDEEHGGFDLALANAGIGTSGPLRRLPWAELERVLHVDAAAAMATLHALAEPFCARGGGTLAATTSLAGRRGIPGGGTYPAAKAALSSFLESLGAELADTGVCVCDLRPGFVRTAMTDGLPYPMPFLLEVDDAARRCVKALERGAAAHGFPWPMAAATESSRLLPAGLWRLVTGRIARRFVATSPSRRRPRAGS